VNVTAHAPTTPSLESYYRPRLLPLIESWRAAGTRVAVFGIGGHTERLFSLVPELATINLVAFLDSDPRKQHDTYRGHAVRAPEWAGGNCDVVLCSSFEHETAQMAMLDRVPVKVVPSHLQAVTVSGRRPGW
jgi:FlaA1/EpsC-like NDP-sugar epimerase